MALQYIQQCTGNCSVNGTVNCHPPEDDMTEIFAPNCGVELPTIDIIYGPLIGCQMGNLDPAQALSDRLGWD
ncbi:hypothetical protein QJS10_CPA01g02860 [Acorus calamus]|uniref:Uncharacterized protein n=1 Tax=Acorus calamus TaxID=4465 RepID=A0AAV9FRT0_ACOCL|nr:hypothetical protein QJS10_CPA01g02860 [Acorus calamus]